MRRADRGADHLHDAFASERRDAIRDAQRDVLRKPRRLVGSSVVRDRTGLLRSTRAWAPAAMAAIGLTSLVERQLHMAFARRARHLDYRTVVARRSDSHRARARAPFQRLENREQKISSAKPREGAKAPREGQRGRAGTPSKARAGRGSIARARERPGSSIARGARKRRGSSIARGARKRRGSSIARGRERRGGSIARGRGAAGRREQRRPRRRGPRGLLRLLVLLLGLLRLGAFRGCGLAAFGGGFGRAASACCSASPEPSRSLMRAALPERSRR